MKCFFFPGQKNTVYSGQIPKKNHIFIFTTSRDSQPQTWVPQKNNSLFYSIKQQTGFILLLIYSVRVPKKPFWYSWFVIYFKTYWSIIKNATLHWKCVSNLCTMLLYNNFFDLMEWPETTIHTPGNASEWFQLIVIAFLISLLEVELNGNIQPRLTMGSRWLKILRELLK